MTPSLHDHHHDSIADLLDLDAQVLRRYLAEVMAWVGARAGDPPRRILDVGAGTGTGTTALADRFPGADLVAVDASEPMLGRIRERAAAHGIARRVTTVPMNLDEPWPELGSFDIAWASAALHELADPDHTFDNILGVLNPGGLVVVVEMEGPPRFLEDEVGDGLEARLHDAIREARADRTDHPDWTENLVRAGFAAVETARFSIDLALDAGGVGGLYAQTYLRRLRPAVASLLSTADGAVLDALVADSGALSVRHRDDLRLRATRTAWAARRAAPST